VDKVSLNGFTILTGCLKSTESSVRGSTKDIMGAPLACFPSDGQSRSGVYSRFNRTHLS
jgi:hypothetical protein